MYVGKEQKEDYRYSIIQHIKKAFLSGFKRILKANNVKPKKKKIKKVNFYNKFLSKCSTCILVPPNKEPNTSSTPIFFFP
jgi:hypothetical protein